MTYLRPHALRRDTPIWEALDARFTRWYLKLRTHVLCQMGLLRGTCIRYNPCVCCTLNDAVRKDGKLSCARMGSGGVPIHGTTPGLAVNDALCSAGQLSCARMGSGGVPSHGTTPTIAVHDTLDANLGVVGAWHVFLTMTTRASCVACIPCTTCCSAGRRMCPKTPLGCGTVHIVLCSVSCRVTSA